LRSSGRSSSIGRKLYFSISPISYIFDISSKSKVVRNILGLDFASNFVFLPAEDTRRGILIAARESLLQHHNPMMTNHSSSVMVIDLRHNFNWMFTGVYGPHGELEKKTFS
jgi:hypothetical protein